MVTLWKIQNISIQFLIVDIHVKDKHKINAGNTFLAQNIKR